jgi:ubiquinone/menaquinone biosynthesis C-methylase UbiE
MEIDRRIENEINHWQKVKNVKILEKYWSSPVGKTRFDRRALLFKNFLGDQKQRVLEVGCGIGTLTKEIIKTKNEIIAIDISPNLLEIAKKKVRAPNVLFKINNAYKTDFKDNYFNFIVGISTLHHLDIKKAVKEFFRLLKPGGKLLFSEPNMLNPQVFVEKRITFLKNITGTTSHETALLKWKIRKQLLSSGFNQIEITPFDFFHPLIPGFLMSLLKPILSSCDKIPLLKEIAGSLLIKAIK